MGRCAEIRKNSTEKGKINMKWWKKLLVLLIAGVVCGAIMRVMALWVSKNTLSASAAEQTYGDLTYVLHNGNAEITGCAAGVTALEIPAEIDGSPVTAVVTSAPSPTCCSIFHQAVRASAQPGVT